MSNAPQAVVSLALARSLRDQRTRARTSETQLSTQLNQLGGQLRALTQDLQTSLGALHETLGSQDASGQELQQRIAAGETGIGELGERLRTLAGLIETCERQIGLSSDQVQQIQVQIGRILEVPKVPKAVISRLDSNDARLKKLESRPSAESLARSAARDMAHDIEVLERRFAQQLARPQSKVADGVDGDDGWSPQFRIANFGTRSVLELYDWIGGEGDKPATGFVGTTGLVEHARDASDLRGAPGVAYGGGGGLSEERVIELIETSMPTADIEYPRIVTTVTAAGPSTLHTPASGKAIRVRRIKCTPDPDSTDTPMLTLRIGAKLIQRGPVLYGADFVEGAVNDPLVLDLESAASIGVTILYEEFTP